MSLSKIGRKENQAASAESKNSLADTTYISTRVNMPVADRFQLWIDGVGGYLILLSDQVLLGQAVPQSGVDLPILGDLSRRHAWIRRVGTDYLLDPMATSSIGKQEIKQPTILRDEHLIGLGRGVQLKFKKKHPLSSSAVLSMVSHQRTEPACDGVILMGETCVLGPSNRNHVICPKWQSDVVLICREGKLLIKSKGEYLIQGSPQSGTYEIQESTSIQGEDFSFYLERLTNS